MEADLSPGQALPISPACKRPRAAGGIQRIDSPLRGSPEGSRLSGSHGFRYRLLCRTVWRCSCEREEGLTAREHDFAIAAETRLHFAVGVEIEGAWRVLGARA